MIVARSADEARQTRRRYVNENGGASWATDYFGLFPPDGVTPETGTLYPVAFMVEFDPHFVSQPHFHVANQFQVFVSGSGSIGKEPLRGVTVHYASAYSPYGPLTSDAGGLTYLTLRNGWDPGIHYLPKYRDELHAARRKPRAAVSERLEPTLPTDLMQLRGVGEDVVLPCEPDGLGAWRYRIPAQHVAHGPDPAAGGGQYWLVLEGGGDLGGRPLGTLTCLFLSPDEERHDVRAGAAGLDVLALQFPP